jgi:calcium permeable stress-gated cation channel
LMLGFAAAGIYLYYLSYRYNLLFVIQPKSDTRGDAYALALQHLTTGVYLSELCLIGLFGVRKAAGPSIMMVVLLVLTIIYHLGVNRILRPVEQYLPRQLQQEDEEAPLVNGEGADHGGERETTFEQIKRSSPNWVPSFALDLLERFFLPDADAQREMRSWFESDPSEVAKPSQEQLDNAYVNPAMTSKTPKLWLVKDSTGVSSGEIEENNKAGISSTDDGAELDGKNHLVWDMRDGCGRVPIFKEPMRY